MAVNGIGLAAAATGALFIYSGVKGYSIPMALQNMVTGRSPATGQVPPVLAGTNVAQQSTGGVPAPNQNLLKLIGGGSSGVGSGGPAPSLPPLPLPGSSGGKHKPVPLVFPLVCPAGYVANAAGTACVPSGVAPGGHPV